MQTNRYPVARRADFRKREGGVGRTKIPMRRRPPVLEPVPKPKPVKPIKFPGPPRPYVPFGRPIPKPGAVPGMPRPFRIPGAIGGKLLGRVVPILGWLLLAYDLYELWQWYQQQTGTPLADAGWFPCCDAGDIGELDGYSLVSRSVNTSSPLSCTPDTWQCGLGGQTFTGPWPDTIPAFGPFTSGSSFRAQGLYLGHINDAGTRQQHGKGYKRVVRRVGVTTFPEIPTSWPEYTPLEISPMPVPYEQPENPFIPWVDPFVRPLNPEPVPMSPPVRRPIFEPYRPEMSHRGHGTSEKPNEFVPPKLPRKPPPGMKERKVKGDYNALRRWLGWLISAFSEGNEVLEAIWDTLPDAHKTKPSTIKSKFADLYAHPDEIDMADAMSNLIYNDREDAIFGPAFDALDDLLGGGEFGRTGPPVPMPFGG